MSRTTDARTPDSSVQARQSGAAAGQDKQQALADELAAAYPHFEVKRLIISLVLSIGVMVAGFIFLHK